jgi:hypothetical protein
LSPYINPRAERPQLVVTARAKKQLSAGLVVDYDDSSRDDAPGHLFELERRIFWIRKSAAPAILNHVVYESEHARDYFNNLLAQIFDIDPTAVKSGRANAPISMRAIQEIPFEWESEAVTICLDQMTGQDSLPGPLMASIYADEREALQAAVKSAQEEDEKGTVTLATTKRIHEAVAKFRAKFLKNAANFEPGYDDSLNYFTTMASLSRLLNDPSMKMFLEKLENREERTVGNLIAFMDSYNLRFGPATSDRQIQIYTMRVPMLTAIRDQVKTLEYTSSPPDRTGEGLNAAAKEAFKPMKWDQLEAHAREQ